jgi:predicted metal-dependent HD superfamily phosphohydrolase
VKSHIGVDPTWQDQVSRLVPGSVVSELKKKYVFWKAQKHWTSLMSLLRNPKNSEAVFSDLVSKYNEPHRSYHNLEHIVSMLDELGTLVPTLIQVALAIWLHDAIYDPKQKNNEELSAEFAKIVMRKLKLTNSLQEKVSKLVLITKHSSLPKTAKEKLLVDLDLTILGKPEKDFDIYENGIREEYHWAPESEFLKRRIQILISFLERPHIYTTKIFREKYEEQARKNLKKSIERLSK